MHHLLLAPSETFILSALSASSASFLCEGASSKRNILITFGYTCSRLFFELAGEVDHFVKYPFLCVSRSSLTRSCLIHTHELHLQSQTPLWKHIVISVRRGLEMYSGIRCSCFPLSSGGGDSMDFLHTILISRELARERTAYRCHEMTHRRVSGWGTGTGASIMVWLLGKAY